MAQQWRSLLFLLLLLLLVPFAAAAGQDAPFVVAQKKVALSRPGPGVERLAVTLNLYNQGSASVPSPSHLPLPPDLDPHLSLSLSSLC